MAVCLVSFSVTSEICPLEYDRYLCDLAAHVSLFLEVEVGKLSRVMVCWWYLAPAVAPPPPQTVLLAHLALISLFWRHFLHAFATLQLLQILWDHFAKKNERYQD